MLWVGIGFSALLLIAPASALIETHRSRKRWGVRIRVRTAASDGPYREGSTSDRIQRRAPLTVWLTALLGPAWAVVTFVIGALATIATFGVFSGECRHFYDGAWEPPGAVLHVLLGLSMLVIAAASPVLALRLIGGSDALPTAGLAELSAMRATAIFGAVHHAVIFAWSVAYGASHDALETLPVFAIPCALGMLVTLLSWRASADVARALAEAETASA